MAFLSLLMMLCQANGATSEQDQYYPVNGSFNASHILVSYSFAADAPEGVVRKRKEALALCDEILKKLREKPELFEDLARKYSDGPTGKVGGYLMGFNKDKMAPQFQSALEKLEIGEISAKPAKTSFGFHIIRRDPLQVKHYAARGIILTYQGAAKGPGIPEESAGYARTRQQAKDRITHLAQSTTVQNFIEVQDANSDHRIRGGFLGIFPRGKTVYGNAVIDAIADLEYGQLSGVVELPSGFAILQRVKVEKRTGTQILIAYEGAAYALPHVKRSKSEAAILAKQLAAQLVQDPSSIEALAQEHSDGPMKPRGGVQVPWFAGTRDWDVERIWEKLNYGQVHPEPIETERGYVLLRKDALD